LVSVDGTASPQGWNDHPPEEVFAVSETKSAGTGAVEVRRDRAVLAPEPPDPTDEDYSSIADASLPDRGVE
jgi:hypothetical protein